MGIRESLHKNSTLFISVSLGVGLLVLAISLKEFFTPRPPPAASSGLQAFYTTDDGATQFADAFDRLPPFDHDGKPAVKAFVFSCDAGVHRWVQYLQKWTDEGKAQMELLRANGSGQPPSQRLLLVKKPGFEKWTPITDPGADEIKKPTCPDGMGSGVPDIVSP